MRGALALTLLVVALATALEWALDVHHPAGVLALAGAAGCTVIVAVSKALGKWWLQRPEPPGE
jgi:hypothetical protein